MAQAPVFDGSWDTRTSIDPNMTICIVCEGPFMPKVYGRVICSNACGAVLDKQKIEKLLKSRPEGNPQVE